MCYPVVGFVLWSNAVAHHDYLDVKFLSLIYFVIIVVMCTRVSLFHDNHCYFDHLEKAVFC
jgi:hypothetical protein